MDYNFSDNYELNFVVREVSAREIAGAANEFTDAAKAKYIGETTVNLHELVAKVQSTIRLANKKYLAGSLNSSVHIRATKADPVNDDVISFRIGSKRE